MKGVHYFGLHGAEGPGKPLAVSKKARLALSRAKREFRARFRGVPTVWLEDKGLSFAIHFRGASRASVRGAETALAAILAPMRGVLHLFGGNQVWEILPKEIRGKGPAVRSLLGGLPKNSHAVYVGDDLSDEGAFAALSRQTTVRVGKMPGTHAHFYLRNQAEVLRFLIRFERELR